VPTARGLRLRGLDSSSTVAPRPKRLGPLKGPWTLRRVLTQIVFSICYLIFGFIPYVVCIEFPRESYHYTAIVAGVGSAAGMLSMLLTLLRGARRVGAIILYVAALCVIVFDLVWSMIIVGLHWGSPLVSVLNIFTAGVGTILGAIVALLFAGDWAALLKLVIVNLTGAVFFVAAARYMWAVKVKATSDKEAAAKIPVM